jgi:hypothetical protein
MHIHKLIKLLRSLVDPPKNTLRVLHPYNHFTKKFAKNIKLPNCMHHKLYDFIIFNDPSAILHSIEQQFPYLPKSLINETLKCTNSLLGYYLPPPPPIHPLPRPQNILYTNQEYHLQHGT